MWTTPVSLTKIKYSDFPLLFHQRETGFDAETLKLPKTSTRDVQQALPYESAGNIRWCVLFNFPLHIADGQYGSL